MSNAVARRNRRCLVGIGALGVVGYEAVGYLGRHPNTPAARSRPVRTVTRTVVQHAAPAISGTDTVLIVLIIAVAAALVGCAYAAARITAANRGK